LDGHYFESKNCCFSAIIQVIAMKCGTMTHRLSVNLTGTWKF